MTKAMQLRSKIKNLALKNKIPAQAVLQNFMLERLLERITLSNPLLPETFSTLNTPNTNHSAACLHPAET
jgi:hypothetical protein